MDLSVRAEVDVNAGIEATFDYVVAPETAGLVFDGYGPIPGTDKSELVSDPPMRKGSIRRIHNSDGSVIDEEITALDRPTHQAYVLPGGFRFPLSLLVREGRGSWQLDERGGSTHITWTFTFVLRSFLAWPFAAPMRGPFRKAMLNALRKIRHNMES